MALGADLCFPCWNSLTAAVEQSIVPGLNARIRSFGCGRQYQRKLRRTQSYLRATLTTGTQQLHPIFGRGLAQNLFEYTVEVRQGLESDLEGYFTDPQIRIEQEILGFFNP